MFTPEPNSPKVTRAGNVASWYSISLSHAKGLSGPLNNKAKGDGITLFRDRFLVS